MLLGMILDVTGICPIIKRLWTPSFTLYVGGVSILLFASLFWIIDVMRFKWWVYPFACMGMNSLLMFCLEKVHFGTYIKQSLEIYFSNEKENFSVPALNLKGKVVDTTGAGDAFNGGLAVGIAEGKPLVDTLSLAMASGAFCVGGKGAQEAMGTRKDILNLLKKQRG